MTFTSLYGTNTCSVRHPRSNKQIGKFLAASALAEAVKSLRSQGTGDERD